MFVYCFTVTRKNDNPTPINIVYEKFGNNIPKYLEYEGGGSDGNTYLCCVDIRVNVKEICEEYHYECGTLYQMEIAEDMYNDSCTINPTYKKEGESYVLQSRK